jgi:hypothetical protein
VAAAHRGEPGVARRAAGRTQIIGRAADAGPIDVTFDTGDDTIVVSKKLRRKNCGE